MVRRATGARPRATRGPARSSPTGRTTPYKHAVARRRAGGGSVFAGTRDDPFFFDLPGLRRVQGAAARGSTNLGTLLGGFTATDTFAGTNVLSIAIRLPNAKLGGTGQHDRRVRHHVRPRRTAAGCRSTEGPPGDQHRVQRADPALRTPTTTASRRTRSTGSARRGRGTTTDNVTAVLNAIGNVLDRNRRDGVHAGEVAAIASVLLPDELTLTLGSGAPFASGTSLGTLALNGRQLGDDVIDAEFALLTNFVITTGDGVGANDKAFLGSFPYLAGPH